MEWGDSMVETVGLKNNTIATAWRMRTSRIWRCVVRVVFEDFLSVSAFLSVWFYGYHMTHIIDYLLDLLYLLLFESQRKEIKSSSLLLPLTLSLD